MSEYDSLKNELLKCRDKANSGYHGAISIAVAILAFSVALYEQIKDLHFQSEDMYVNRINWLLVFVQISAVILPTIILYLISIKIRENYKRMLFLSLYIQILYEFPSLKNKNCGMFYESMQRDVSTLDPYPKETRYRFLNALNKKTMNSEYYVIASFVAVFQTLFVIIELYGLWNLYRPFPFVYLLLLLLIPGTILTIMQMAIKYNTDYDKTRTQYAKTYAMQILKAARSNHILQESEKEECNVFIRKTLG